MRLMKRLLAAPLRGNRNILLQMARRYKCIDEVIFYYLRTNNRKLGRLSCSLRHHLRSFQRAFQTWCSDSAIRTARKRAIVWMRVDSCARYALDSSLGLFRNKSQLTFHRVTRIIAGERVRDEVHMGNIRIVNFICLINCNCCSCKALDGYCSKLVLYRRSEWRS